MALRVGIVSYDGLMPQGGQGVYVSNLARKLPQHGIEPVVFSARGDGNGLGVPLGGLHPLDFSWRANRALPALVREHCIDLVHAQGGPGGVMMLRHLEKPLVYTAHHLYSQQRTALAGATWKGIAYRVLQRLEARGYGMAQGIVAVSSTTASALVKDYSVPDHRIWTVPDGVDIDTFRPLEELRLPGSLLYVGRLHRRKGLEYLLDAMPSVLREVPGSRLYLIGQGSMERELVAQVHRLSLDEAVTFLGRVDDMELCRWYNRAQAFVLPSLLEGFGMVCLEAMACGTPVVATRVPGIVDAVTDQETGLLVPPGNARALAESIVRLLKDRELRHEMGHRGIERARRLFTWDRVASETASFYRQQSG
ncbi:MAG: glycosyltransferase family 4 protein [Chloroflexota bacterium]